MYIKNRINSQTNRYIYHLVSLLCDPGLHGGQSGRISCGAGRLDGWSLYLLKRGGRLPRALLASIPNLSYIYGYFQTHTSKLSDLYLEYI